MNDAFSEFSEFPSSTPRQREPYWKRFGGGSLAMSLLVHGVFAAVAVFLIKFAVEHRPPENISFVRGSTGDQHPRQSKPLKTSAASLGKRIVVNAPTTGLTIKDLPTAVISAELPSGFGKPSLGGGGNPGLPTRLVQTSPGPGVGDIGARSFLPAIYRSRCSPQERSEKMRENGGSEDCERAVVKALDWLKSQQRPDGSWGAAHHTAMTGLALLCYYGHCETPESPFYGTNVLNGVTYLIDTGGKHEGFLTDNLGQVFCQIGRAHV